MMDGIEKRREKGSDSGNVGRIHKLKIGVSLWTLVRSKLLLWGIAVLLVAALATALWFWLRPTPQTGMERVTMRPLEVRSVRAMVELCSVELDEDLPVRGSVGDAHLFAKMRVEGTISFNLEELKIEQSGDSVVRVTLPPEKIVIRESTAPGAYQVIDSWNDKLFGGTRITTARENEMKRKTIENFRRRIYARGYVKDARREARNRLATMLAPLTTLRVEIIDPRPNGYPPLTPSETDTPQRTQVLQEISEDL